MGYSAAPRIVRTALYSLLLAAVALFFLNLNVFGTASVSKRFSQDLVYAWFGNESWLYPRPAALAAPPGAAAPRVVVVMVDERALALRGARWPAPLQFHAQFLAELEVLRPRAILLDFLLIDPAPPEDVCALLAVGARLRQDGSALYLAVTGLEDLTALDAAGCRDATGARVRASQLFTPVSVRRQVDGSDFVSRRYPFEQRADGAPPGSGLASAAVRIYCDTGGAPAACLARLTAAQAPDAGFELAWSPAGDSFPKLAFYTYDLLVLWVLAAIFQWRQRLVQRVRPGAHSPFELSAAASAWIAPLIARCPTPVWILAAAALLLLLATFKFLQLLAVALTIVALVVIELRVAPAAEIRDRLRGLLLYLEALGVSLAVIVLAVWIGYRWLRLPPGDWLGYFSFVAFGFFVAHTAILEFGRRIDELNIARRTGGGGQ
jgi:hypothetical protein